MSNKTPLLRMIFLVIIFIILLIIFSTYLSNNVVSNTNVPFFKEYFIWQEKNKAYTLLRHSVTVNDSSISAYSVKFDTIMTFSILPSEVNIIPSKLGHLPYTPEQCIKCHNVERN